MTKAGTNQFHGNLYELWNGSKFNAANFFTKATPGNHKPRSTVNHLGGSLGGPILRNKLFFFFDSEWVRIALPIVSATTVPTPAFQSYVLQQLPLGRTDSLTGSVYQPAPRVVPFYEKLFSLYRSTAGTPQAVPGCPFNGDGSPAVGNPPNGNGCANRQSISHSSDDHEQVQTARMDYNINEKNSAWLRLQADSCVQAAVARLSSSFDAITHDVNQPLNLAIYTNLEHIFASTPLAVVQPRTAIAWQLAPKTVLRTGFGFFSDILPGSPMGFWSRQITRGAVVWIPSRTADFSRSHRQEFSHHCPENWGGNTGRAITTSGTISRHNMSTSYRSR